MKKRGRPVTTGPGILVSIRFHSEELERIDLWIAQQPNTRINRTQAIRRLTAEGLAGGFPKLIRLSLNTSRYDEFVIWAESVAIPTARFVSTRNVAGELIYDILQLCWDSEEGLLVAETWTKKQRANGTS